MHNQSLLNLSDHRYHRPVHYHIFLQVPEVLDWALGLCLVVE